MSKRFWLAAVVVLVIALGAGFVVADRATQGIAGYLVWRATSGEAHSDEYVDLNGVRLHVETFGEGAPLLLVHGGMGTIESMHNQITAFAGDRFVIAPDSREHGRSGPIDGVLHYADMADDMVALLDHLDVAHADVFGWSDGGIIALDLAMRYPDRVGKIALFGVNYHHDGLKDSDESLLDSGPDSEAMSTIRTLYQTVAQDPDRWPVFFEKVHVMWDTEPEFTETGLQAIAAPTLIMVGEHDVIKPDHVQSMAQAIPNATLEILAGDDHFAPMRNPDAVNALLAAFFGE
jgi:pimeloyl-ACP methyl ester carboxylesterase